MTNERLLREWVRRLLVEFVSGQQSERNLSDSINNLTGAIVGKDCFITNSEEVQPILISLGDLGERELWGACQAGGGQPEPKADVVLLAGENGTDQLGVSMKKLNFAMVGNWMDRSDLKSSLLAIQTDGTPVFTTAEAQEMVDAWYEKVKAHSKSQAPQIQKAYDLVLNSIHKVDPSYVPPNWDGNTIPDVRPPKNVPHPTKPGEMTAGPKGGPRLDQLVKDKLVVVGKYVSGKGQKVMPKSILQVDNYYVTLKDALGRNYLPFLEVVLGGDSNNPRRADGVLTHDVTSPTMSLGELDAVLSTIKSISNEAKKYAEGEEQMTLRFRPSTAWGAMTSKDTRGKFRADSNDFFTDPSGLIKWSGQVQKGKVPRTPSSDDVLYDPIGGGLGAGPIHQAVADDMGELLGEYINESLLIEELTKTDKREIERIARKQAKKEIDKVVGNDLAKTIQKEVEKTLKNKATKKEMGDITKAIVKKLYKQLAVSSPQVIDRIKV